MASFPLIKTPKLIYYLLNWYRNQKRLLLLIAFAVVALLCVEYLSEKRRANVLNNWTNFSSPNSTTNQSSLSSPSPSSSRDWQPVSDLTVKYSSGVRIPFRVYSAFSFQNPLKFDSQLIVIGSHVNKSLNALSLRCLFSSSIHSPPTSTPATKLATTPAVFNSIPGWNIRYAGVFIKCPFPSSNVQPNFVSIIPSGDITTTPTNLLPINYQPYQGDKESSNFRFNFSVCVLPTHGTYNNIFNFLEWLEYYKMLGIQHFTLYNMSISSSMSCIWDHLSTSGQITVHSWQNFPLIPNPQETSWAFGKSAALTDCQFRYTGISKYVAVVDFDEFITPLISNVSTLSQLINFLDSTRPRVKFGEYVFKNGFFMLDHKQDPLLESRCIPLLNSQGPMSSLEYQVCKNLLIMKYVQRDPILKRGRTKYIMMPERTLVAGNHDVNWLEKRANFKSYRVPADIVAYHRHYRAYRSVGSITVERIDLKVGLKLAKEVAKQIKYFQSKCGLKTHNIFV